MSGPKHSMKMALKYSQQAQKTKEEELEEKCAQLSKRNAEIILEVQKFKNSNAYLLKRSTELSQKHFEACAEVNRLKELIKEITAEVVKYVPFLVQGSVLVDNLLKKLDRASIPQNSCTQTVSTDEGMDENNSGGALPGSPQRTGIAMPMVKGHSISKPSISLQRVIPRQTAMQHIPMPIRSTELGLADMVRAHDENGNRPQNDVHEENLEEIEEGIEDNVDENGRFSEENGRSEEDELNPEEDQHNLEENEVKLADKESSQLDDGVAEDNENMAQQLSVVEEEHSNVSEELLSSPSLIVEEVPSSSEVQATSSQPVKRTRVLRQDVGKSKPAVSRDQEMESSDEEEVEISLIEARSKLMNGHRRKELKEGTSRDYDEKGDYSLFHQRRAKRKKMSEDVASSDERAWNETSALRKSVDGLLNSLKKSDLRRSKSSTGDSPSLVSRRINGFVGDEMDPRVSLVRMSLCSKRDPSSLAESTEAPGMLPLPGSTSPPLLLSPTVSKADVSLPPVPATPGAESPIMVTRRRPCSFVTTRNKKSSRQRSVEDAVVVLESYVEVEEEELRPPLSPPPPPQRPSAMKRRKSWKESIRKRNRVQLDNDSSDEDTTEESELRTDETNSRVSVPIDELPSVVLSRCPQSLIARNCSSGAQDDPWNESAGDSSDTPLSLLALRADSDDVSSPGRASKDKVAAKPARAKPRSKPKPKSRSKPSRKSGNKNDLSRQRAPSESLSAVESDSHNSLNRSSLNSSFGSLERSSSAISRPRRAKAPTNMKEKPLNLKMRREN